MSSEENRYTASQILTIRRILEDVQREEMKQILLAYGLPKENRPGNNVSQ